MRIASRLSIACVIGLALASTVAVSVHAQAVVTEPDTGGNQIIQPKPTTSAPANVTVNVTPPPPDPQATQAMMDYFVANTEYNHGSVPVTMASGLLSGPNIWTNTPWSMITVDTANKVYNVSRNVTVALFLLGIIWTGFQLLCGPITGTTKYQQLLPMLIAGFMIAMYSDLIAQRAVEINNWICSQFGNSSLADFSNSALKLPDKPEMPTGSQPPGIIGVPAAFFSGLITSLVYAIVLIILELKMVLRDAILIVTRAVMPVAGALWAFEITRSWGAMLFKLFFGWLFGQPLVVVCLSIAGSLLTFFNNVDGPAQILVKLAVLFLAIKMLTIFASALGGGGLFGLAGVLFLLRNTLGRASHAARAGGSPSGPAGVSSQSQSSALQSGGPNSRTTGTGSAATGRPWRPAYGTA